VRELPHRRLRHGQQQRNTAPTGRHRRRWRVRGTHRRKAYGTTSLRALWQHAPYFHDGSAARLADVVAHYNRVRGLGLTTEQQRDLVEYLKSV